MFRNQTNNRRRAPRVVALVATTLATLALVVAFAPLAVAQTPDPGPPGGHPPSLTDAQKTCLTQHGVTPPAPGSAKPTSPPSAQQRRWWTIEAATRRRLGVFAQRALAVRKDAISSSALGSSVG